MVLWYVKRRQNFVVIYQKNLNKPSIIIDGDIVRKYISHDLGYDLSDRKIQINRVYGIAKICIDSNIIPIISTVYMNNALYKKLSKHKIKLVQISEMKNSYLKKHIPRKKCCWCRH